jgi:hypothetical protein
LLSLRELSKESKLISAEEGKEAKIFDIPKLAKTIWYLSKDLFFFG